MLTAFLAFIAAFLLISSVGFLAFYRQDALGKLLSAVLDRSDNRLPPSIPEVQPGTRIERIVEPFQKIVPRSPREVTVLKKRLVRAGLREKTYVNIFYGAKVMVPVILCLLATITGAYTLSPMFVYAVALGLGFLLPDFWLDRCISNRQLELTLGLPEAVDLIVICIEAGLSLDKAVMRTCEELRQSQPEISDELNLVILEQRAGRPRADAWKNLAERTAVKTIRSLTVILIQADKFGSSVGKTLRAHSETLRTRRRQDAEEKAAQTPVKLVFPLVLCIFPSLFLVTLGPSMIIMFEGFAKFLT